MTTEKEAGEFKAEEVLDRYFPKGHKQRGNALLLYACAKLEGQKKSKDKLTLNHKCPICNRDIFLGDNVVIQKRIVYHLKCYDKEEKQDE